MDKKKLTYQNSGKLYFFEMLVKCCTLSSIRRFIARYPSAWNFRRFSIIKSKSWQISRESDCSGRNLRKKFRKRFQSGKKFSNNLQVSKNWHYILYSIVYINWAHMRLRSFKQWHIPCVLACVSEHVVSNSNKT